VPKAFAEVSRAMRKEAAVIPVALDEDDDVWPRTQRGNHKSGRPRIGRPIGSSFKYD